MNKLKILLFVIAIAGTFGFILYNNKKEIDANATVKEEVKNIPVMVAAASYKNLSESLTLIGTFKPHREIKLVSEISGKVVKVGVEEGDYVKQGQLIAQVDNEMIRAQLIAAEANFERAQKDIIRFENLRKGNAVTDVQVEDAHLRLKSAESQLLTLRKQLRNTTIVAPISGTVTTRSFELGSVLLPGIALVEITDISRLKLTLQAPEKEVVKYNQGSEITVQADVYPQARFSGKVTLVGVKADAAHNYPVEILVANQAQTPLRAGMYGRASTGIAIKDSALAIPRTALVGSIKNPQVYVVENNKAVLKDISVGADSQGQVEVLSGLKEGDQVVVSGQINLENNSRVSVIQ
jgi:RND family efflux transporter MFP subunit